MRFLHTLSGSRSLSVLVRREQSWYVKGVRPFREADGIGWGRMLESKTHTRVVTATSSEETTTGELLAVEFGSRERWKRAVVTALKCLGCTLVCLFIPGAHFILVPLGLLLTPVVAFIIWRVRTKILSAKVTCPKCGGTVQVLTMQERYPLYETCAACHREVSITVAH